MLGISATGLRIYTTTYPRKLSTEATGKRRKFTEADLCFLAYIKERTDAGDNHRDLLNELETDEGKARFAAFEAQWQPLPPDEEVATDEGSTAMVPVAQLHAVRLLWEDAQRREQEAKEETLAQQQAAQLREKDLQEQINQLLRELGHKEGELEALRASKPKSFWARLLGRANP